MDNWDFESDHVEKKPSYQAGEWDVALTIVPLLAVTGISFLSAYLSTFVASRPFWMLGLCFAAPVAALMLSVYFKERIAPSMTPSTSRKAQLGLAAASILAAAVVGCFCQVSNEKADTVEEMVVGDGWSNVLIILDKSYSMGSTMGSGSETRDVLATRAVKNLIQSFDDKVQVGMLIDAVWVEDYKNSSYPVPVTQRTVPIAPLTTEQRNRVAQMADFQIKGQGNFILAFAKAYEMAEQWGGENGTLSILLISDGVDTTNKFKATDYAKRFIDQGIKVNYLYVNSEAAGEVKELARLTGGESIRVTEPQELLNQMKRMVTVPITTKVYKDALRNIDESDTAKTVTGALLLLLGILIGVSLVVMLSVHGQRRLQLIISPLMALCAFAILAFGKPVIRVEWIREGIAFSLLGIVFMRKNMRKREKATIEKSNTQDETNLTEKW